VGYEKYMMKVAVLLLGVDGGATHPCPTNRFTVRLLLVLNVVIA
jgi:hypothetical protein